MILYVDIRDSFRGFSFLGVVVEFRGIDTVRSTGTVIAFFILVFMVEVRSKVSGVYNFESFFFFAGERELLLWWGVC